VLEGPIRCAPPSAYCLGQHTQRSHSPAPNARAVPPADAVHVHHIVPTHAHHPTYVHREDGAHSAATPPTLRAVPQADAVHVHHIGSTHAHHPTYVHREDGAHPWTLHTGHSSACESEGRETHRTLDRSCTTHHGAFFPARVWAMCISNRYLGASARGGGYHSSPRLPGLPIIRFDFDKGRKRKSGRGVEQASTTEANAEHKLRIEGFD
jgi:hypothetical protein